MPHDSAKPLPEGYEELVDVHAALLAEHAALRFQAANYLAERNEARAALAAAQEERDRLRGMIDEAEADLYNVHEREAKLERENANLAEGLDKEMEHLQDDRRDALERAASAQASLGVALEQSRALRAALAASDRALLGMADALRRRMDVTADRYRGSGASLTAARKLAEEPMLVEHAAAIASARARAQEAGK